MSSLSKISTQWSEMEGLLEREGPAALADYVAARYFNILAGRLKKYAPTLDELQTHELVSDILYELIKNDYRHLKRLDRNRGHLRGLFFKIIRQKLYHKRKNCKNEKNQQAYQPQETQEWVDIYVDLGEALLKLEQVRPRLYKPFVSHYLEGKTTAEIASLLGIKANAVKQRLYAARCWLAQELKAYER